METNEAVERMRNQIRYLITKYQKYISNIDWHNSTNKPDANELYTNRQRIDDFNEVITSLRQML